ncbi:hypothetical protein SAMN05518849_11471 [Sphingobium sp. AP50]|uniref:hypothetical protein n=1 Tax=Sphingobium sp. AP50 TaxID=1884369 RepID=UPI0008CF0908|nr:hypothetical protein [Sphingobium sp. AP50]SEJ81201.1 hypothetical protein SAMN05518849_11471 [Sphingobium sp. AP50]
MRSFIVGGAALIASAVPSVPAHASTLSCQVIICLSNPGGPTQYRECVPPISELWRMLARGASFPKCSEGGVVKSVVRNLKSPARRSVELTYRDGRRETLSLANIEQNSPSAARTVPR